MEYTYSTDGYKPKKIYNNIIKRCVDLIVALILAVCLSPVYIVIAIIIKLDSPGPVFYRGVRCGRYGKPFRIFKFRSMVANAEKCGGGTTALNDARITKSGNFLRKCKLDEIPQLFNIIKGDMSFIGPRPELLQYTDAYIGDEKLILDVRPGITDMSSIEFISLDEMVGSENADEIYEKLVLKKKNALRIKYVTEQTMWLDVKLFFSTVGGVISKAFRVIFGGETTVSDNESKSI